VGLVLPGAVMVRAALLVVAGAAEARAAVAAVAVIQAGGLGEGD
jgi:hypothetical protein